MIRILKGNLLHQLIRVSGNVRPRGLLGTGTTFTSYHSRLTQISRAYSTNPEKPKDERVHRSNRPLHVKDEQNGVVKEGNEEKGVGIGSARVDADADSETIDSSNTPTDSASVNAESVEATDSSTPPTSNSTATSTPTPTPPPTVSADISVAIEKDPQSQRYYYYFDTQKIYSSLKYSGYTSDQADVLMKTIRDLLSRAITECQENSIPQWAAENEAYLFEAACSELKNEIQTTRQDQAEQYRANLARLQRDVELLGHEIDEVINTLKVEIDMEVNERKNATRAEENAIQLKIQELNNKITIEINSDVKSEIEALRWQTTRRGLMAIIFVAFLLLAGISITKKEAKPVVKRREVVTGEEIYVPILTTSEIEEIEDRKVELLK